MKSSSQVIWSSHNVSRTVLLCFGSPLRCSNVNGILRWCKTNRSNQVLARSSLFQPLWKLQSKTSRHFSLLLSHGSQNFVGFGIDFDKLKCWLEKLKQGANVLFISLAVGMMLSMSVSVTVSKTPSCKYKFNFVFFL